MKADTYVLVRILQKKDNTIDEIKVIDIDNNKENLEKKIRKGPFPKTWWSISGTTT